MLALLLLLIAPLARSATTTACTTDASCASGSEECGADEYCTCKAGYGHDAVTNSCSACVEGYYKPGAGRTACIGPVGMGYYTIDASDNPVCTGAVDVVQAAEGRYAVDSGGEAISSGACGFANAQAGYYAVDSYGDSTGSFVQDSGCSSGAVNEAQAVAGRYACAQNDIDGTGINERAFDACSCPAGYFANSDGMTSCTMVHLGYYGVDVNDDATSASAVDEMQVPAGSYACVAGDYDGVGVNLLADDACLCPAGYYSTALGSTECTQAASGYYTVDGTYDVPPSFSGL